MHERESKMCRCSYRYIDIDVDSAMAREERGKTEIENKIQKSRSKKD